MRITSKIIDNATRIQRLQSAAYQTGTMPVVVDELREQYPDGIPTYTQLCDFPHSDKSGQTTRELFSFTAALAHLISVPGGSFVTALTEEAASYIDEATCADFEQRLLDACKTNNLQPPDGLEEAA